MIRQDPVQPHRAPARMKAIERVIRRRADGYLAQSHLPVDDYRIRRRLAYTLPLRELPVPDYPVAGLPVYPWATWPLRALR